MGRLTGTGLTDVGNGPASIADAGRFAVAQGVTGMLDRFDMKRAHLYDPPVFHSGGMRWPRIRRRPAPVHGISRSVDDSVVACKSLYFQRNIKWLFSRIAKLHRSAE